MLKLKDPSLLRTECYINGKWVKAKSGKTFTVKNPFDDEVVAEVADSGQIEAKESIECAQRAFEAWKKISPNGRGEYLKKWAALIAENGDDISAILTHEQGKPLEQSNHELMGCVGFLNWNAEEAKRVYGYTPLSPDPDRRFLTLRQPLGVVAVITPWNFPSVLILQKCAPALAAGCTVIVKPAKDTPLSALVHAELAHRAGIPAGVFNVLPTSNSEEVGSELTSHPLVRKLTFTGSTKVGKHLMSAAGKTVKKTCFELGGNCPAIIFDDADLDKAALSTFWFKFYNAGQCCNNINRFLIQKSVYKAFAEKFQNLIKKHLKLGFGMDKGVNISPLINQQGIEKVEELVNEALSKGAEALCGGSRSKVGALFYEPTLLVDAKPEMRLYREEIFGPVAAFYTFGTEEEAIRMANDTNYGLAGYVYTENIGRSWRVSEAVEAGSIGINTHDVVSELVPFGGWKESGVGRENSVVGNLNDYCETKTVVIGGIKG